mgnify:CR=1 FL=1
MADKECPGCGAKFVGLERLCFSCRRTSGTSPLHFQEGDTEPHVRYRVVEGREICPSCKRPMRPLTNAERQRGWRARAQSSKGSQNG